MRRIGTSQSHSRDLYTFYIYIFYSIFVSTLLCVSIKSLDKYNVHGRKSTILFFCIFFSVPIMASSLFLGNSAMFVLDLLLFFFALKDSESRIHREISLIILSCCIAIKIYPLVFLFLYIMDKRYKEIIRLILYNSILFFGHFILFGGIDGFIHWMSNIKTLICTFQLERIQYIQGISYKIIMNIFNINHNWIPKIISVCISIFFLVLMFVLAWKSQNKNRTVFFLVCAMVFFPVNAFRYTLGYLAIPLALWLLESKSPFTKEDWVYGACNGLLFSVPIWIGIMTDFNSRYMDFWLYFVAYLLVLFEIFFEILSRHRVRPLHNASIP